MTKKAILLTNLGSPDSYEVGDVKTYLKEFLMDEKVIDLPYLLRYPLVKGLIVPLRAAKSAERYKSIWTENGSPLVDITRQLTKKVEEVSHVPAYMCMRYGNPAPGDVLKEINMRQPDLEELVMFPLYPHYAMSSYETAVEHIQHAYKKGAYRFKLNIVPPFYEDEDYIHALTQSIAPYVQEDYDHILFSYHGIPERHVMKTDITGNHCMKSADCCSVASEAHHYCYRHQVIATTKLVVKHLNIPDNKYSFSFQSRLGRDKWLKPDTAVVLKDLPGQGIKKLLVVCPAFVSDCLETIEEIETEGKEIFMNAGGTSFTMIPCLNTSAAWVEAINRIVNKL